MHWEHNLQNKNQELMEHFKDWENNQKVENDVNKWWNGNKTKAKNPYGSEIILQILISKIPSTYLYDIYICYIV